MQKPVVKSVVASILAAVLAIPAAAQQADEVFLFSYFLAQDGGTYLAWSEDGRSFHTLNGGQPVIKPPQAGGNGWPGGQSLMRDPSLVYRDGTFHLVWTTNWEGSIFGHASSNDLKTWATPQAVSPYAAEVLANDPPKNVWAPEVFYDHIAGHYKIVWAATHPSEANDGDNSNVGSWDNRQWYTTTTDFQTFTEAARYYDGSRDVIDGFTVYDDDNDRWVMAIKDNSSSAAGNHERWIRLVFNDQHIAGNDWSQPTAAIAGTGAALNGGKDAEGPTLIKHGDQWLLYWDAFRSGEYGMASSADLVNWTDETANFHLYDADGNEIAHPRHGTVLLVPRSALTGFEEVPQIPEPGSAMLLGVPAAFVLRGKRP